MDSRPPERPTPSRIPYAIAGGVAALAALGIGAAISSPALAALLSVALAVALALTVPGLSAREPGASARSTPSATGPAAPTVAFAPAAPAPAEPGHDVARIDGAGRTTGAYHPVYMIVARSVLRQAALAIEKADDAVDEAGRRTLLALGHAAATRGQELLARYRRLVEPVSRDNPPEPTAESFPLREDIAAMARALGFEHGREVALRFAPGFPVHVAGDRALVQVALTAMVHTIVATGPAEAEILIEASHEDDRPPRAQVRIAVSASGRATIGDIPEYDPLQWENGASGGCPVLNALGREVERDAGRLFHDPTHHQMAMALPVTRVKKVSGSTLYGIGTLPERSVLVIDPRPIGRVTVCEQLAAWQLSPSGVGSVSEALAAAQRLKQRGQRFDVVVVSGFDDDGPLRDLAANLQVLGHPKVLMLESLDTTGTAIDPLIAATPGLSLRRLPRPPGQIELIETLTRTLAPAPSPTHAPEAQGSGLSLLLAEDNLVNQALMVKMLERRGHRVFVVGNGADLVDHLSEAPDVYDAVLCDIQMPVMDGYEAAIVIRLREAQNHTRRVPIIAVTAHAMGGERERCIEAGMDAYLSKPIGEDELAAALDEVRKTKDLAAAQPAREPSGDGVFDRRNVLELASGDFEFLRGLVGIFSESAPRLVERIEKEAAAGNAATLMRAAHQLKGSIGNFSAPAARGVAAAIEERTRAGDLDGATTLVPELRKRVDELVRALETLVRESA